MIVQSVGRVEAMPFYWGSDALSIGHLDQFVFHQDVVASPLRSTGQERLSSKGACKTARVICERYYE